MDPERFPLPIAAAHQWVVYLTARCNFACDYCIQKGRIVPGTPRRPWGRYDELPGHAWVEALNAMPVRPEHTLILTGGEPTLHRDFYEIATGLKGYRIDLTSNLSFDVDRFVRELQAAGVTFYSSFHTYHPKFMEPEEFVEKARLLRAAGVIENPVFSLLDLDRFPHFRDEEHDANIRRFVEIARARGLPFQRNEFRGNHMGAPFAHEARATMRCTSGWVNFAPNGDIYNCQYHLEAGIDCFGNVTRIAECRRLPRFGEFFACPDFGLCDPCHENSGRGAFMDGQGRIFRRTADDARIYLKWMEPARIREVARRYLDEGRIDEAREALLVAAGRAGEDGGGEPAVWTDLGLTLWAAGERDKALAALLHAIEEGERGDAALAAAVQLGRETGRGATVRAVLAPKIPPERLRALEDAVAAAFV